MLTTEIHYRIERDEEARRNKEFQRLVTNALRWWPEPEGNQQQQEDFVHGKAALRQLSDGASINERRLQNALAFLEASIVFYESNPWEGVEPFEGRNAEAAQDLRNVLDALTGPSEGPVGPVETSNALEGSIG